MPTRAQSFFTPARMDQVEALPPGWRAMCSQVGEATLTHVSAVLTALLLSPEYRRATADQQAFMEWIVLFHDVTKRVEPGRRDHTHSFRSAASAARALPAPGFAATADYPGLIEDWVALTESAVTRPDGRMADIQDNSKLPEIIAGIDRMFGRDSPAALVVQAVLLHMSITVVEDWPQAAPLTESEVDR